MNEGKETYMTIEEVADYLKLAKQIIRKFVLHKSIPYRKVQKSVRFRLSEIEQWIDHGGMICPRCGADEREGDLFADAGSDTGKMATAENEGTQV
jgi:excisionase family DNA binding protein